MQTFEAFARSNSEPKTRRKRLLMVGRPCSGKTLFRAQAQRLINKKKITARERLYTASCVQRVVRKNHPSTNMTKTNKHWNKPGTTQLITTKHNIRAQSNTHEKKTHVVSQLRSDILTHIHKRKSVLVKEEERLTDFASVRSLVRFRSSSHATNARSWQWS